MDTPLHPSDPRLRPHLLALDREPAERGALDALARVYGEHGEWDGLLRVYEREALRAPDANARAELYFDMGCVWEERIVNRPQAMRCYQLAYRANPRARKPLVAAERVYRELGQWSMVARLLELQIDAEDDAREKSDLYFALGELARQELADDRRAAEAYQNGLGLIPDHARCRDALAAVETARAGRESVATELRAEAEAADDLALRASLYLRAAELLHREHRGAAEVEDDLRRVLAIEPENPRACELLAETLHGSGRYDDLTTFLRDCAQRETDPGRRVGLLARLASYAAERGDDEGAVTAYEAVLAIDPHQPDALAFVLPALRRRRAHGPLFELADRVAGPNAPADVVSWVLREAGDAAWREAADRARAEKYLGQLRAIAPHDPVARAFFRDLPKTLSPAEYKASYGQLVKQARGENDPAQKREHLRAAARLAAEHGSTPKEAIDAWRAVLEVDKADAEARAHLRALYRRNERWHALVEILKQEVEQLPSERVEEKVALLEEMVDIYGGHLSMEPMVVNTLHALLQVTPGHRPTLDRLAKLYEKRESWGQLADVLARKAETSDDPAERLELLHRAADLWLSRLQSPEDAIRRYEQVLAISPADARALAALRKIYEQRRAYEPLVQVYLREIENLTNDDERLRRAREIAEWGQKHLHRPARLIELWNRVLSFDSHDAKALTALAALYEREERWQALGEILQRQIAESSDKRARVMTMKKLGSVFADRLAREDLAMTTWQAALDEDPENPEVFKILRDRYVRAHKFEELEALYAKRGKWEEYVDVLVVQAEATREVADKCRVYFQIADLWENKLQRTDRAARVYERVLEVDPHNVRAAGALKPLLEKGSEWRKLVQVEEVLAAADTDEKSRAEKWRHVSRLYEEKLRRPTDAFASLARAIADDPTAPGAIERLEQLADATGAWAETAEAFERARPHATTPAEREDLSLRAARIYDERLENGEKAIAAYEAVLADAPEHEAAEAALARLYEATQSWAPLTKLRRAQLERTSAPDRREALRFEMARIEEDLLDDAAAAIASYEAILAERDDATSALQALARLYTKTERPAELALVLERQLARAENAAERIDLLRRLGYLAMGALKRPAEAVQHFEALLEASPDDAGAEKALEKLRENEVSRESAARILANRYRARGAHEPLLSALRTLADCLEDRDERLELLLESARLEEVELKRAEDAHATYARALREAPADERAFAELDRLSALLDREAALAELITSLLSEVESVRRKSAMSMRAGDLFTDLERRADAIGAYQRALELGLPDDDARTTLRALSRLYEAEGDFAALRVTLQSALDLTETAHDRKSVLLRLGALYEERLGDTAAATDAYRNALALAPDDEIALARLDTLYHGARDWERLAAVLEAKLRNAHGPGERAALHMRFGHLLAGQLNRTAEALGEFRSVLEIDADSDEAVTAIEALVEYDADLAGPAAETLAPIYERRGDQEKVRTALEALLPTRAPEERVDILLRVGAMSEEAGNLERAYDAYSRALREGPGHAETRTRLGRAADALGRWPKLLEALEVEIPNVVRTDEVLAILETMADAADRKLQDPAQAIALYARMLALDAAHTLAFDRTSEILARETRFADLVALIERREPIVTESEEAQRLATRKGELLERELRDPRAAIAAYRKASQIAPQHVETLEALERLYVAEGEHAPLLEVHLQRAELAGDAGERRRRILAAAKLAETELDDRIRAITLYRRLTDADPADVEALACLARLCEAEDDATALLGVLQLWVAAVHDDAERVSLRYRIAALTEGPLGDPAQAIELYRDILADAPDHAPTLAALEALAESGTERLRAARVLAQVYEAHGDPGALVRALEAELSETDDPSTRVSLLHRIAHLYENKLGLRAKAFDAYRDALRAAPLDAASLANLERIAADEGRTTDLADAYDQAIVNAAASGDAAALGHKLARLYDDVLAEPARAIDEYRRILDFQRDDAGALRALDRLYTQAERWSDLAETLRRQIDLCEDPDIIVALHHRLGDTLAKRLDDAPGAVAAFSGALGYDARHEATLRSLRALLDERREVPAVADLLEPAYRRAEAFGDVSHVLEVRAETALTTDERKRFALDAASIQEEKLASPRTAFGLLARAFREDPADEETVAELMRVAHEAEAFEALASVLEEERERVDDAAVREHLELTVAQIHLIHLQDTAAAAERYEAIVERNAKCVPALRALDRIYTESGEHTALVRVLVLEADSATQPADAIAYRLRRADTEERLLGDLDAAISTLQGILEDAPDDAHAIDALERIFRARDDAEQLFGIYERRLALAEDDPSRLQLLSFMAALAGHRLERHDEAIDLWTEVEKLADGRDVPTRLRALAALERLYDLTNRYPELAEVLGKRAALAADPDARASLNAQRATVFSDRLNLAEDAIDCWQAVLQDRPGDEPALAALTALFEAGRRFPELAQNLEHRIGHIESRGATADELIPLYTAVARVHTESLMRPASAVDAWLQVLELDPEHIGALEALEQLYAEMGEFEKVVAVVERRSILEGTADARIAALFRTAELRDRRMNDPAGAATLYEQILEARPDDPRASEALESICERIGNHDRVAELLLGRLESIDASWERLTLLRRIADIYLERLSRADMAFIVLCRALREDARDAALLEEVERLARTTGNFEELVAQIDEVIAAAAEGTDVAPLHAAAARYNADELGRADAAVDHFHELLALEPNNTAAVDALEALLRREGRLAELAAVLRKKANYSVELDERKAHLYAFAELCEGPLGHLGEAAQALEEVFALDEGEDNALLGLRRIYRRQQRWQDLIRTLERQLASTEGADALELRREIATIYDRELAEPARAADVYREVLAADPGDQSAVEHLERILSGERRFDELVHLLSEQLAFAETPAQQILLHEKIGRLWEQSLSRPERASDAYRALLKIDPRNHDALDALERLYAARGEWREVADVLERLADAARSEDERIAALRRLGDAYEHRLGDTAHAVAAYQRVLEIRADEPEALAALAGIYERAGDHRLCCDMLERAARVMHERRRQAEVWHRVAVVAHHHLRDFERAEGALRYAIGADPTFVPALTTMRTLAIERGDFRRAIDLLSREDDQTFDAHRKVEIACEMGRIAAEELDDRDAAIQHYELALERAPESARVAEPLADLHYKRGDFPRARGLLEIVRRRADATATGPGVAVIRFRLADAALRAGDEAAALTYFQEAYELDVTHLPTLTAFGELLFTRRDWERAFKVYQSIVVHHSDSADVDAVDVYHKLGVIRHELGERRKAIHSFDKALELDPGHVPTLRALCAIHEAGEAWEDAVEMRKRLLESVTVDAEKREIAMQIGDLYREKLGQRARAIDAYTDALDLAPGDLVILHKLLELFTEGKEWPRAIDVLEQIAARERDPEKLGTYLYSVAVIYRDELKDADAAIRYFNRTLDANATRLKAFEAIDKLLTQRRDWAALAQNYRTMMGRLPEGAPREIRLALWRGLGEIYRTRLRSYDEAIPCFREAAALAPNDLELQVILSELYELNPETYALAIDAHKALLSADPARYTSYHALQRLHRGRGEHDRAYWLCHVLRYLGQLDQEELQYLEQVRQVAPKRAQRPLDERSWHYVLHPNEDRILGRIFALVTHAVAQSYLVNPRDLGVKKKDRIETGDMQIFFSRIFQLSRGVLGVAPPEVYLSADRQGLTLMNTTPVTLLVGPDMVQDRPEVELAFALAKNLSYLRPEHFVSALLPPLVDTIFYAAVRACYPTQKLPADRKPHEIDDLAKRIRKALPPTNLAQLQTFLQQFYQQGRHFDAAHWLATIEHTGDRAGFVVCNDLSAAERILLQEPVAISALTRQEKMRAVLDFSLSEDYAVVRQAIGLAVQT